MVRRTWGEEELGPNREEPVKAALFHLGSLGCSATRADSCGLQHRKRLNLS